MTADRPRQRKRFQDLVDRAAEANPEWELLLENARADRAEFHPQELRPAGAEEPSDV